MPDTLDTFAENFPAEELRSSIAMYILPIQQLFYLLLSNRLTSLLQTSEYSDFIITCREKKYHVHKAILCPRSEFFSQLCKKGTWKVHRLLKGLT